MIATDIKKRRLSVEEVVALGATMRAMEFEGEHPTGLAAIRLMLMTGLRRMEVLGMQWAWAHPKEHCVAFPDTKSGQQVRIVGRAAMEVIQSQPMRDEIP